MGCNASSPPCGAPWVTLNELAKIWRQTNEKQKQYPANITDHKQKSYLYVNIRWEQIKVLLRTN